MEIILYHALNQDLINIRQTVFCDEQGFQNEFEDFDAQCNHLVLYVGNLAVGCLRYFQEDDHYVIGRVAVLKSHRHQGYASLLMEEAEKQIRRLDGTKIVLSAQCKAQPFYLQLGYKPSGEIYYDEWCPHIHMEKELA